LITKVSHGDHVVTPYFTVRDADAFIEFLSNVFGAVIVKESRYHDGKVQHVRMRIGDSLLMLNESSDAYPANVSQMHVYVENVDFTYTTALNAGASSLMEPNVRPHGDRMAGIKTRAAISGGSRSRATSAPEEGEK
jgi:PhnB protein